MPTLFKEMTNLEVFIKLKTSNALNFTDKHFPE